MPTNDVNERIRQMLKSIEAHRKQNAPITSDDNKQSNQPVNVPNPVPLYQDLIKSQQKKP